MSNMQITIDRKSVYGRYFYYPACDQAHLFAQLVNKKTLTLTDLDVIAKLGVKITQKEGDSSWIAELGK